MSLSEQPKHRNWIICAEPSDSWSKAHLKWALQNIPAKNDNVVLLLLNSTEEIRAAVNVINKHGYLVVHYEDDLQILHDVIEKEQINTFFSHASFSTPLLQIRQMLLTKYFHKVLPVWYEGGFYRHVTFQHDWLGWNACGSLAKMDINKIPELTSWQRDFVHDFVLGMFLTTKLKHNNRRIVQSKDNLRELCKTNKPICLIALQVMNDTVVVNFAPPEYRSRAWAFQLADRHRDMFFIIKDHPLQIEFSDIPKKIRGANWLYLPHLADWDTQTMGMHADLAVTVNSTVGFELLFWTPVVATGKSVYTHDQICYRAQDFRIDLPAKKESDIYKYLHYAITRYHFTPSIMDRAHWLDSNNYHMWACLEDSEREDILKCDSARLAACFSFG